MKPKSLRETNEINKLITLERTDFDPKFCIIMEIQNELHIRSSYDKVYFLMNLDFLF